MKEMICCQEINEYIDYYEKNGYNITSKIYRGAEHKVMFSTSNPCLDLLLRDLILFYKNGHKFTKDRAGVNEISMQAQREREQKLDKDREN